jgi:hypothetical protein
MYIKKINYYYIENKMVYNAKTKIIIDKWRKTHVEEYRTYSRIYYTTGNVYAKQKIYKQKQYHYKKECKRLLNILIPDYTV